MQPYVIIKGIQTKKIPETAKAILLQREQRTWISSGAPSGNARGRSKEWDQTQPPSSRLFQVSKKWPQRGVTS
ncbi:hypothetical protein SAMN05444164_3710 [Bradyrhizobium erythrophlei]|uniref:Uncharacterized protein n=1 Tax=Bradyrhizobium erythrophlei TaxID=1437360 RepID=A0A1H4Y0W3_9BRAD|nr:hypothetical protein SAMN05444164_3710 [Bradyrhizobium erythrophlei]